MLSETTYRYVTDVRGSVLAVVDADSGAVAQELVYDPYGRVLSDTNVGFQPFAFASGLYDAETGLVRFGARDYDAEVGRWTAKDPIGFGGGDTVLYAYVGGDPVGGVDPTGLVLYVCRGPWGRGDETPSGFAQMNFLAYHMWIVTDAAEFGKGGGLSRTTYTEAGHSARSETPWAECRRVEDATDEDEAWLNQVPDTGRRLGAFIPFVQDCRTATSSLLRERGLQNPFRGEQARQARQEARRRFRVGPRIVWPTENRRF